MAKGAKKHTSGDSQPQLPNHWVKVTSFTGQARCTECGGPMMRGMRWVQGSTSACKPCGQRLARHRAA